MDKQLDRNAEKNKNAGWLLILGVVLVGANLRLPLTSIGALIPFIREDLAISNALAGAITTLPLLAFAVLSPFAPKIANRIGMEWTIAIALLLLIIGTTVRSLSSVEFLFAGTLLIGLAIAIGNVLIPGIVKMNFPLKVGLMTGIYAIFMNLFGALGSGLSVPLSSIGSFSWEGSLGIWVLLGIVSLLVWLPQLKKKRDNPQADVKQEKRESLWRSPLAWQITLFMGGQSLIYYTLITWLPDILYTNGFNSNAAGWIVFLMQFALIPLTFIVPIVAEKMKNQVALSVITASFFIIGILGFLQGGTFLAPLWAVLIGVAAGSAFSLSMMFFTIRSRDGKEAAELSGMAQSFGYLLAAVGPIAVGALQDLTGSWTAPLLLLLFIAALILLAGMSAGKEGQVSEQQVSKKYAKTQHEAN
ncbi:MAG TPA: MFS transporter [Pseudogracilibacillus sp.]|nr:MFS transporter [Pseudogracilibacillus sp.]